MIKNVQITKFPEASQQHARIEFEHIWNDRVGWELPDHVGDKWWPLTKRTEDAN